MLLCRVCNLRDLGIRQIQEGKIPLLRVPEGYADALFHPEEAVGDGNVKIDLSAGNEGYVGVSAVAENRLKFQVIKDDVILSNVEILNFDETIPVYLAQHGGYFAVLDIKAMGDGKAEVTMLKL